MLLTDANILVTGGHGFIGSRVVERLKAAGVKAERISVPSAAECDLRIRLECERIVRGMGLVVHLAAITGGIEFHREHPGRAVYENALMGLELMEASRRAGVKKFVGIGSAATYPADAPMPFRETSLRLDIADSIHLPYNAAKLLLLIQGQAYRREYGFNAIHLVLTNIYGLGDDGRSGYVIPNLIRRVIEAQREGKTSVEVWGSGRPSRDFLYVDDAAFAIVRAAEIYESADPINIGSGREVSIRDLAETILRLMDFRGSITWLADKPDGVPRRVLDITRAREVLGFNPATSLEEGLQKTIAWHRSRMGSV